MDYNKEIDNAIKSYYLGKLSENKLENEINNIFKNSWYEFCKLHIGKISLREYKINISKIEI